MEMFRATSKQMLEIWDGRFEDFVESTVQAVDSGVEECWLMRDEQNGKLMGELHILWDKPEDPDYADGKDKAYILAFRIHDEYQGKGYGTMLMNRVLNRIQERGFTKATIGADDFDPKLQPMYQKWGFTKVLKRDSFDYHYDGRLVTCTFTLLENSCLTVPDPLK